MSTVVPAVRDSHIIAQYGQCKAVVATAAHALELAPLLREHDRIEVGAFGFEDTKEVLLSALSHDDVTIAAVDGDNETFAMLGVGSKEGIPYIWLLGSEGVQEQAYVFAKASKQLLPSIMMNYPTVMNYVLKDYTASVRWLKWLGAKFIREVEINGYRFYEFIIIK